MSEIKPALTAEEWPAMAPLIASMRLATRHDQGELLTGIALSNAALPDDSPYKLVAADVRLLRGYAEFFRRESLQHPRLAELDALADKLNALLPPDPEN